MLCLGRVDMGLPIEFHHKARLIAAAVDNEGADRPLSAELATEVAVPEMLPEDLLGRSERAAQLSGASADGRRALGLGRPRHTLPLPHPSPLSRALSPGEGPGVRVIPPAAGRGS
jgi:hypothetical protein